jgi:hypothetical protein
MKSLAVALAALVIAGACGDPSSVTGEGSAAVTVPTLRVAPCPGGEGGIYEEIPMGINTLSAISDAVVLADVVDVGTPRWNSNDGRSCPPAGTRKVKYRDIAVKVTEVVAGSPKLNPAVGDELVVMSFCDEAFTAADADPAGCGERNDGPWSGGSGTLLILCTWDDFPTEGGERSVIQLTGSWGGHWEVDRASDTARSSVPGRTVPLGALLQRIRDERKRGWDPGRDEGTRTNPLGQ